MGNFYCPDGSGLQSLTQTNPQHSWDFFFLNDDLLAKQRISQCTEHNKNNLQFSRRCWEGRTSSNPLPRRNKTKPEGKDCCNEAVPSQNRPGGGQRNPTAQQLLHPTPRFQHRRVKELQLLLCMSDLYQTTTAAHLRGQAGGGKGMLRDPRAPPGQALSPRLARGRGTSRGLLRFEEAGSVPCLLEQA